MYEADGYLAQRLNVLVNPWDLSSTLKDITLAVVLTGTETLNLTVQDENENPIPNVEVILESLGQTEDTFFGDDLGHPTWTSTSSAEVNETGNVSFTDLAPGNYRAWVNHEGYFPTYQDYAVSGPNATVETLNLTASNPDNGHEVSIKVKSKKGAETGATVTMYRINAPAQPGETVPKYGGSTYYTIAEEGDYLFTAEVDGLLTGVWMDYIDDDIVQEIEVTSLENQPQDNNLIFDNWGELEWTVTSTQNSSIGRNFNPANVDVGLTGVFFFDVDRIWGDNDGTAETAEFLAYANWENDLDVPMPTTDGFLKVAGSSYTFQDGSYAYTLTAANGSTLGDTSVTSPDNYKTTTSATYTADMEDDAASYKVKAMVSNSNPGSYDYSYAFDWPADYETTKNTTDDDAQATVTGTPDSGVTTGEGEAAGGWVTFTVTANEKPTPDIEVTTQLKRAVITAGDGQPAELWVVMPGVQVNFSAAGAGDSMEITYYRWIFTEGTTNTVKTGLLANHTFDVKDQNVTVNLTVRDAHTENSTEVIVYVDDTPPTAAFNITVKDSQGDESRLYNGSNIDEEEDIVVFDATNSSDSFLGVNGLDTYEWLINGPGLTDYDDTGPIISLTFDEPGNYTVKLTLKDKAGNIATQEETVSVNDITGPEPLFTWYGFDEDGNRTNEAGIVGQPIHFNATNSTDNSGEIVEYVWDFIGENAGDIVPINMVANGSVVEVIFDKFLEEGYKVTLTLRDRAGNEAVTEIPVHPVKPKRPDLVIGDIIKVTPGQAKEGDKLEFKAVIALIGENVTKDFKVSFYYDEVSEANLLDKTNNTVVNAADINAGDKTYNLTFFWNSAEAGGRTIIAFVDSNDDIFEGEPDSSEEENTLEIFIDVKPEGDDESNTMLIVSVLVVIIIIGVAAYFLYTKSPGRDDY